MKHDLQIDGNWNQSWRKPKTCFEPSKHHLLIIDDEMKCRVLLGAILEEEGFQYSTATSGEEALALIDAGLNPDAILVDFSMPGGMNGVETFARLRSSGVEIPVILVSSIMDIEDVARKNGFDGSVPKPGTSHEITEVLGNLLVESRENQFGRQEKQMVEEMFST